MKLHKVKEKLIETLIYFSGNVSALIVIFIIYFLFSEGSGLFKKTPTEEGYSVVVNRFNLVEKLSDEQLKKIFEGEYTNWSQLGGNYDSIVTFTLSDVEYKFTAEELGENFEHLNTRISEYIDHQTGVIAYLPDKYIDSAYTRIEVNKITLAGMLQGKEWYPTSTPAARLGVLPIILGSVLVSLGAIAIAFPLGLLVAIFLSEIATENISNIFKTVIELLAGIPSVVYGFFGLIIIVPMLKDVFNMPVGESALAGSIILSLISLPTIISLSADAISSVPAELKNASLALGANQWQTIVRVTIPYAVSGIVSATILGVGRAFGETMAVLMVTGNAAVMPASLLEPVRTITATIAAELGEAPTGGIHFEALFVLGSILFVFTFVINLTAEFFAVKKRF